MGDKGYNTNLAAEFYVLSVLHRLGLDASLTLGNKKSVDIAIIRGAGEAYTVDVKGLAGKTGWPIDNIPTGKKGHFLVFVSFLGKIDKPEVAPEAYVVPSTEMDLLAYDAPGGRRLLQFKTMRENATRFKDKWELLI
ncbi:MAG: hypothetical protein ABSB42_16215 [Tepidisphaeraceae bacterium]